MASFHESSRLQIHQPRSPWARNLLSPKEPRPSIEIDKALKIFSFTVMLLSIGYFIIQSIRRCFNFHRNDLPPAASDNHNITIEVIPDKSTAAQLEAIPVVIFGSASSSSSSSSSNGRGHEKESCSVCLAEYMEGEDLRVLPRCRHMFHKDCIDRWLTTRSSFCPLCRERAIKPAVRPARRNGNNLW